MAQDSTTPRVFARGDTVLDYWLARAEGFTLQPSGGRVEEIVLGRPSGRAETLIVRSRSGRRRAIPAAAVAAVDPSRHELLVAPTVRRRVPRPSLEHVSAHASTARTWLEPRAVAVAARSAHVTRATARRTYAAAAWTTPRIARGIRTTLSIVGRATIASARAVAAGASILLGDVRRLAAEANQGRASARKELAEKHPPSSLRPTASRPARLPSAARRTRSRPAVPHPSGHAGGSSANGGDGRPG